MPKGLIIIDGSLLIIGIVLTILFFDSLRILPFIAMGAFICIFNVIIGASNSPDNVGNKFRCWLFGE